MRRYIDLAQKLMEAAIERDRWKFWCNAQTGDILWFGGADHHAHAIYYDPQRFGLTAEQVAPLADHPAMEDVDEDDPEEDLGARVIYLPNLFWQVMQHGWVRGGLEGDYDRDDSNRMHPYGLYLEGKSLPEIAKAAKVVASEVEPDEDDPWDNDDAWTIETLRIDVRTGPQHGAEQHYKLQGERARYFIARGRIPSTMMSETIQQSSS